MWLRDSIQSPASPT